MHFQRRRKRKNREWMEEKKSTQNCDLDCKWDSTSRLTKKINTSSAQQPLSASDSHFTIQMSVSLCWRRTSDLTGEEVRPFNTFLRQNILLSPSPSFSPLVLLIYSLYSCIAPLSLISYSLMCFNLHLPAFAPFNLALTSFHLTPSYFG